MIGDLHRRLRAATEAAHAGLEHDLGWERRVATVAGYRALLARLRGFHAAYEPAIGAGLADEPFFGPRRRLDRLDADLAYLGLDAAAISCLPFPDTPRLDGPAALGALYVLEGSTLGGQVIGRRIAALHGLTTDGLTYYRAHGPATGAMWSAFRARLETVADEAALTEAAVATFRAMRDWLCADDAATSRAA
ncbi:biliverdin-producing heme oxygenase [Methylobacterium radiodurans]|uniref:Biliverdin-producing heme oxygenase n=1 Tax=Methylobacterium radiodurans TaxID=2202828 RepID=A0A2U8VRP4_9HYPH|nr:biliverdin-producing heme oxygenase [Methylobacterium radiodurans]AWN36449.1 biliverdin-producing heme oxygenase [Methylobacterium radiodurans]